MTANYLISVVIPTRNRSEYTIRSIEQILSIRTTELELVIQDNSDTDELKQKIDQRFSNDSRIRYNYSNEDLSFVDNFSQALSFATGEYLLLIGDDDGINPAVIEIARWASKHKISAIKPSLQAVYVWPAAIDQKNQTGHLSISKITTHARRTQTKPEMIKLLNNGCQDYLTLDLVKLYHGLVQRSAMEKVKEHVGNYFRGLSPDIYSAAALSVILPEVISIDYPLTISGICQKSGSADSATGRHTGNLKDAPHFRGHKNYKWSPEVPPFYSVETIWADSTLSALKDLKAKELLQEFRLETLTSHCLVKHKKFFSLILRHYIEYKTSLHRNGFNLSKDFLAGMIKGPVHRLYNKVNNRFHRQATNVLRFKDVPDIAHAEDILSKHLERKAITITMLTQELERI